VVTPHPRRLLVGVGGHGSIGRCAGRRGNGGAHERHKRYWPGRRHVLEGSALGPPSVGRGPGPAGRSGTPPCCHTGRCWLPRMDGPPGIDPVIQAEVRAGSQHQPADVASGDPCSRPSAEVPAESSRPRRRVVGEWLWRMPGTRPGQGNGHRRPARAALVWRPRGLLPRGSHQTRPGQARRRCPRRPTLRCLGRQPSPATGQARSRESGYRPVWWPSLGPPGASRGQREAGHVSSSGVHRPTSTLLRRQ
jgi:hypothetical protein